MPDSPINFTTTGQYDTLTDTTITFSWYPPQGDGVETVVDDYLLSIVPTPLSHSTLTVVLTTSINVTLRYNTQYMVTLRARNCAGESSVVAFSTLFSKLAVFDHYKVYIFLLLY